MGRAGERETSELHQEGARAHVTLGLALVLVALAGCGFPKTVSAPPPAISTAQADREAAGHPGVTLASLNAGREHFVAKCNGCHGYPDVATIGGERWPEIVKRMGKKADLTEAQAAEVLAFIRAAKTP